MVTTLCENIFCIHNSVREDGWQTMLEESLDCFTVPNASVFNSVKKTISDASRICPVVQFSCWCYVSLLFLSNNAHENLQSGTGADFLEFLQGDNSVQEEG